MMSNEALLAFRRDVMDRAELTYTPETVLNLMDEIIRLRKEYENLNLLHPTEVRGKMMRTRKEWYDFSMKHGTSGDQVFDILRDWKKSDDLWEE